METFNLLTEMYNIFYHLTFKEKQLATTIINDIKKQLKLIKIEIPEKNYSLLKLGINDMKSEIESEDRFPYNIYILMVHKNNILALLRKLISKIHLTISNKIKNIILENIMSENKEYNEGHGRL